MSMPGPTELIVILVIVILLFGAKRLPELGSSVGKGLKNFKDSIMGKDGKEAEKPQITGSCCDHDKTEKKV